MNTSKRINEINRSKEVREYLHSLDCMKKYCVRSFSILTQEFKTGCRPLVRIRNHISKRFTLTKFLPNYVVFRTFNTSGSHYSDLVEIHDKLIVRYQLLSFDYITKLMVIIPNQKNTLLYEIYKAILYHTKQRWTPPDYTTRVMNAILDRQTYKLGSREISIIENATVPHSLSALVKLSFDSRRILNLAEHDGIVFHDLFQSLFRRYYYHTQEMICTFPRIHRVIIKK